jgi:hypothetical protein
MLILALDIATRTGRALGRVGARPSCGQNQRRPAA